MSYSQTLTSAGNISIRNEAITTPQVEQKHKEELMYFLYVSIIKAAENRDPKTQSQLRDIDSVELYKQAKSYADSQLVTTGRSLI